MDKLLRCAGGRGGVPGDRGGVPGGRGGVRLKISTYSMALLVCPIKVA